MRNRARIRERERGDAEGVLPGDAQRLPAGRQNAQPEAAPQEGLGELRTGGHEVLAVVELEQELPRPERILQGLDERAIRLLTYAKRTGDCLWHELRLHHRGQLGEPDPVLERMGR